MPDKFIGNTLAYEHLCNLIDTRSGLAYLLHGPACVGKHTLSKLMSSRVLDREYRKADPDVLDVFDRVNEETIDLKTAKSIASHISKTPFAGKKSVAIIPHIDRITLEAANALLIPLENIPKTSVVFLTADNLAAVLPTIRSRALPIGLTRVPKNELERDLLARGYDQPTVKECLDLSGGAPGIALRAIADKKALRDMLQIHTEVASWAQKSLVERIAFAEKYGADAERTKAFLLEMLRSGDMSLKSSAAKAWTRLAKNVQPRAVLEAFAMMSA